MRGAIRASPAATTRTALSRSTGSVSLSRNPLAPGPQRLVHVLVEVERRQDHDPGRRERLVAGDPAGRLEAVHHRHPDVHQHHVGVLAGGEGDGLGAVARLADDLDVGLAGEQHREAAAHEHLVVGDHHPDRHSASPYGSSALTR